LHTLGDLQSKETYLTRKNLRDRNCT